MSLDNFVFFEVVRDDLMTRSGHRFAWVKYRGKDYLLPEDAVCASPDGPYCVLWDWQAAMAHQGDYAERVREYRAWRRRENERKTREAERAAEQAREEEEARMEQRRLGALDCHFVPRKSFPKSHQVVFTVSLNGHRPFEWRGYVPLSACHGFACPVRTMARAAARAAEKWPSDEVELKIGPWVFRRRPGKDVVIEDAHRPLPQSKP